MVHCSQHPKELPTHVGRNAVVSSGAILHGCVLEEACLIGEGAQVMDGAKVGKGAVVAPGSFVGISKAVPAGQLWSGVPARYVRDVTQAEANKIVTVALENAALAAEHGKESAKTWQVRLLYPMALLTCTVLLSAGALSLTPLYGVAPRSSSRRSTSTTSACAATDSTSASSISRWDLHSAHSFCPSLLR